MELVGIEQARMFKALLFDQPDVPGPWRKTNWEKREYEPLDSYVATSTISAIEREGLLQQLKTPMETCFRGPAYDFDDGTLTEEWMCSFRYNNKDEKQKGKKGPSDDDVRNLLCAQTLEVVLGEVQDRVCTDSGVLEARPLNLDPLTTREQLVWGIDCSCRRLVEVAIVEKMREAATGKGGAELAKFIQYRPLPAINAQPPDLAHSMLAVTKYVIEYSLI